MQVLHPIPDVLVDQVAHRLAVLAQHLRIRMIERLELDGEMSVQALADSLNATQQNISRHLGLLYESGVVDRRQAGRQVWYRLVDEAAISLLDDVAAQLVNRFRRFAPPDGGEVDQSIRQPTEQAATASRRSKIRRGMG